MNEHVRPREFEPPIRTLEELAQRRWTTAELLALQERGGVVPDLQYELIEGEIVPMPAEGSIHQDLRSELTDFLYRRRPDDLRIDGEPQLNLTDDTFKKPDIVVRPASIRMSALRGPDALLVIEIADSSLDYDTTTKAALYAVHGVREYWVINARTRLTRVHRGPSSSGYGQTIDVSGDEPLVPDLAPELTVRLNDLAET